LRPAPEVLVGRDLVGRPPGGGSSRRDHGFERARPQRGQRRGATGQATEEATASPHVALLVGGSYPGRTGLESKVLEGAGWR
jgi:hypothetical protein